MTSTRSPRSESFTQPSEGTKQPVPRKRQSLERRGIQSEAPQRSPQSSPQLSLPPYPDTSFENSRTLSSSVSSGSYAPLSPVERSPLWEYPGQDFGRGRANAATSAPRSPGTSRGTGIPGGSAPRFEAPGPRRKLSYHPEPTPEITPLPYGPEERPRRRLIPDRRFSQYTGELTPSEADASSTSSTFAYTDEGEYSMYSTGRMKPPCFKMRESMFLSDSSTPGVAPFQFGRQPNSPVYENLPPGDTRSQFQFDRRASSPIHQNLPPGNTRLSSAFSSDSSYTSTPNSDTTGYGTESPVTQQRDSRYKVVLPTRIRKDSSLYFSESDESNTTLPTMDSIDSGSESPARRSNVFVLTSGTFSNFLQLQNKAAVLFYNSSSDKLAVVEDMAKQFVTQNPREERQVYASVDCARESQLCSREKATNTPFFRMYSKGFKVNDAKDFATLTQRPTAKIR